VSIGSHDTILLIKQKWLDLIISGRKQYELRGFRCHKRGRLWLCASGSKMVCASAVISQCIGPLSAEQFERMSGLHMFMGMRPYKNTYAWKLENVSCLKHPIAIQRKRGSVIFQTGPQ